MQDDGTHFHLLHYKNETEQIILWSHLTCI